MGNSVFKSWFGGNLWDKDCRFLMIGLDAAGKTTILYKLKLGEIVRTPPAIGLGVETVKYKNISFTSWDVGIKWCGTDRDKYRPLWYHYYQNITHIIFVVDSNDRERIDESREELFKMIRDDEDLNNLPLLVYANKQDLPNVMSVEEITEKLELQSIFTRPWKIVPSCAVSGDGLYEGLEWLTNETPHNPQRFVTTKSARKVDD